MEVKEEEKKEGDKKEVMSHKFKNLHFGLLYTLYY